MYKKLVETIKGLSWSKLSQEELQAVMILSAYAAVEFADSLRLTLRIYPDNKALHEMARGELETGNLRYADYDKKDDHSAFLWYFLNKRVLQTARSRKAIVYGEQYIRNIRILPGHVRAMSIVSRERELPGVFESILKAPDWSSPDLAAFQYYLKEHIRLDSTEGGHADMLTAFTVTDAVAPFYEARLDLYRCIPTLFKKE